MVGDNEPYSPSDNVDYTIRRHGFDRGLPHVMIEIRNDLLASRGHRRLGRTVDASAEAGDVAAASVQCSRRKRNAMSGYVAGVGQSPGKIVASGATG